MRGILSDALGDAGVASELRARRKGRGDAVMREIVGRAMARGDLGDAEMSQRVLEVGHAMLRHEFLFSGSVASGSSHPWSTMWCPRCCWRPRHRRRRPRRRRPYDRQRGRLALLAVAAGAAAEVGEPLGRVGCAVASAAPCWRPSTPSPTSSSRGTTAGRRLTPVGLKFGSKLAAAAIAVISAAIVLALDANWFAFTSLTIAFVVVVGIGVVVLLRHRRTASERPRAGPGEATRPAAQD